MSDNIPLGCDYRSDAPWLQEEPKTIEVDVTISMTMSSSRTIKVIEGFTDSDLKEAVVNQVELPSNGNNWDIDEFEVIED